MTRGTQDAAAEAPADAEAEAVDDEAQVDDGVRAVATHPAGALSVRGHQRLWHCLDALHAQAADVPVILELVRMLRETREPRSLA